MATFTKAQLQSQIADEKQFLARAIELQDRVTITNCVREIDRLESQHSAIVQRQTEQGQVGIFAAGTPDTAPPLKARRKKSAVEVGTVVMLPLTAANKVPFPNIIARSCLFGLTAKPIAGDGQASNAVFRYLVAKEGDTEALASGVLLGQADLDVWMHCLKLAQDDLGAPVSISVFQFLKLSGRKAGGGGYNWLEGSLTRLALLRLTVKTAKGVLMNDEGVLTYRIEQSPTEAHILTFQVNPKWAKLLGIGTWSTQRLDARAKLSRSPLAQVLVTIANSSKLPMSLNKLRTMTRSESNPPEFKRLTAKALAAAIEAGAISDNSKPDKITGDLHLMRL